MGKNFFFFNLLHSFEEKDADPLFTDNLKKSDPPKKFKGSCLQVTVPIDDNVQWSQFGR